MKERIKTFLMALTPVPITVKGIADWMSAGTTILGFGTALFGFATAVVVLLWWLKKYRREQ